MSYVQTSLSEQEEIVARARLHYIVFLPGLPFLLVGALLSWAEGAHELPAAASLARFALYAGGIVFLCILLEYLTTEYAVTSRRVITKRGWIARRTTETMLHRVEGVHLQQSLLGRVLGYGKVVVSGTGEQKNVFKNVADPVCLIRTIQGYTDGALSGRE
jgi:uncharacterized membrane protein YdbT with pleckstrin-like domain